MSVAHEGLPQTPAKPTFQNPYEGHRSLAPKEQQLLGEYARLAATVRRVAQLSSQLSSSTLHNEVHNELRAIERKMGLVLTLFKASVWAIVMQQSDEDEAEDLIEYDQPYETIAEEHEEDEWESTDAQDTPAL